MVDAAISTGQLSAGDRFEYLREAALGLPEPVDIRAPTGADFRARVTHSSLGAVTVGTLRTVGTTALEIYRGNALIRRSDPEEYRFLLCMAGRTGLCQGGNNVELAPGDLAFYDTSRPHRGWRNAGDTAQLVMVAFPRTLLPTRQDQLRRLTAVKLAGATAIGALVSSTISKVADDADQYGAPDRGPLSTTIVDLLAIVVNHALGAEPRVVADPDRESLWLRIQSFIERRLTDPDLDPAMIGAAHHVATRTVHRIFRERGLTAAGWIRLRRLEACRRALTDPRMAEQPVYAIAARYGFADRPHLTRAFSAAYGVSPSEYRRQREQGGSSSRAADDGAGLHGDGAQVHGIRGDRPED